MWQMTRRRMRAHRFDDTWSLLTDANKDEARHAPVCRDADDEWAWGPLWASRVADSLQASESLTHKM